MSNPKSPEAAEARRKLAADLRDTLIRLGPTFIKVGQLLSTRVDVLEPEVISELARLQNEVPGFPAKRAKELIAKELGKPVEQLFASFDDTPLAAASLAQVHRATLKTGEQVIVKVQRENLRKLFDVDMFNIRLVASLADRLDPQTEAVGSNWRGIAETSGEVLYREIDFNIERVAAEEFASNFEGYPAVKIPKVFPELCTSRLVTMEFCPGLKLTDKDGIKAKGFNPEHLANTLTNSYLEQICRHGFFHCDPHPGNLAVDDGYPGGRLVYYDFGMMERVEERVKKGFVDLVFAIYENSPKEACDALEEMGVLRQGIDRFSIERIAKSMLNTFQSTLASADNKWENEMTPEERKASRRARRAQLGQDLFATQADKPFLLPPKFTFVFRAFTTIDGIGKSLVGPSYDLSRISQPYMRELADLKDGAAWISTVRQICKRLGWRPIDVAQFVTQPRTVASIARTVQKIGDGDLRLRVRTLEVERMLERVELRQRFVGAGLTTAMLVHMSLAPFLNGIVARLLQLMAAKAGWEAWKAYGLFRKLEIQRLRFANTETVYDEMT